MAVPKTRATRIVLLLLPPSLLTLIAAGFGYSRALPLGELVRSLPSIFLLTLGFFGLARPEVVAVVASWCRIAKWRPILAAQCLLLPYLLYAVLLNQFSIGAGLRLLAYVNLPILLLVSHGDSRGVGWREGVAILVIWLPLEFGWLGSLWPWPPGQAGTFLNVPLGVCLAVFSFVVVHRWDQIGFTFSACRRDFKVAALCFIAFVPVGLGIGLGIGFLKPSAEMPGLGRWVATLLGVFLANGIPEELLFRGLIQNLLERWTTRPQVSLALASLIFGAAHLNSGDSPDWRYALLATMAGLAYGVAYRRGGTLMAPAVTHALVNTLWFLGFRG